MKTVSSVVAVLTVLATPALALAQAQPQARPQAPTQESVAAARLPNTFDNPAPARAAAPAARPEAPLAPADARSEQILRTLIAGAQGEGMDYALMTPALAEQVRPQAAAFGPMLRALGTVQAVDWVGVGDDQDLYVVTFSSGVTQWLIGLTDDGKVSGLRFRPAPEPEPAPSAAPATPR